MRCAGRRGRPCGPPTGWYRLRLLRQIGDQLVAGLEQFLLVDDVVAVEDGTALVPGQEHGDPFGDVRADQVPRGGARQSWRKRVGTPAAWQAVRHAVRQRRIVIPSRWKTSGLSGSRRARRRASASAMGGEMGRMRPLGVARLPWLWQTGGNERIAKEIGEVFALTSRGDDIDVKSHRTALADPYP